MKANTEVIKMWATRNRCFMCKHKFEQPFILPVENPQRGKFQPNYNTEILFHLYDTHGLSPDIVRDWIFGSIYSIERTPFGLKTSPQT